MGFFTDATKWLGEQYGKISNGIADGVDKVNDGLQAIGNYAVDGVEAMINGGIDLIQNSSNVLRGFSQSARGFTTNVITGTLNGTSQGIEASVGENVVSNCIEQIAKGMQGLHQTMTYVENECAEKFNEFIDNAQEKSKEKTTNVQNDINEKMDNAQSKSRSTINSIQNGIENSGKAADEAVETAVDVTASVTNKVTNNVKSGIENITTGVSEAKETMDKVTDRVKSDAEIMKDAFSQTALGEGANSVLNYLQQNSQKLLTSISDVLKNKDGNETDFSIKEGVEKITEAVASVGQSAEVSLKNGMSLIFDSIQGEVDVFSSDDLSKIIASSKDGKFDKKDLENIVDTIKEGQGLIVDKLKEFGTDIVDKTSNIGNELQNLFNQNQSR